MTKDRFQDILREVASELESDSERELALKLANDGEYTHFICHGNECVQDVFLKPRRRERDER